MQPSNLVLIVAFDDVPVHLFQIEQVLDDHVTGIALTGPLAGEHGEPDFPLMVRVIEHSEAWGSVAQIA